MNVYVYLLNTLADWEIGFITAELASGRYFKKPGRPVTLISVGNTTETVKTMGGLAITPAQSIESVHFADDDLLILPGANTWMDKENETALAVAADLLDRGVAVAAICGGTIGLASIGALNRHKHTSNDMGYLKAVCKKYTGEANYQQKPAVRDGNLITASGLAPLEFAYEILKWLDVFKPETLEAWYSLYVTRDPQYFYALMTSMEVQV